MLALSLIIIGILFRFIPHAPNFTPVAAIALVGGTYLKKRHALIVPLALMMISDLFIGMHNVVIFTWGSFILAGLLGTGIKRRKSVSRITATSLASVILFYIVSNFGVWLMGWYPKNLKGLVDCYVMALPFLRDFAFSTLLYAGLFFGAYELIARLVKDTKLSRVLLTD